MSLHVLEVETEHGTEWLLTDDLEAGRRFVAEHSDIVIAVRSPADVLTERYSGIAILSTSF